MSDWISSLATSLWQTALTATVPALLILVLLRFIRMKPATRHTLGLIALAWFAAAPLIPAAPFAWRLSFPDQSAVSPAHAAPVVSPNLIASEPELPAATLSAPTPPRTDAREVAVSQNMLAQADCDGGRRSQFSSGEPARAPLPPQLETIVVEPDRASTSSPLPPMTVDWQHLDELSRAPAHGETKEILIPLPSAGMFIDAGKSVGHFLADNATLFWLGGFAALLTVCALSSARFLTSLKVVARPSPQISDMVHSAARQLNLRRPPRTLIVSNRISPMISCIGPRTLLLPGDLWEDLTSAGQRAIIYHELAHLRRKDHWVRWAQVLLGAIYWWNPVVWLLRRVVSEEAENCCDLWVTTLMPDGRRSYAQALLQTSNYLSGAGSASPSLGIGVTRVRARKFARRLTMVMTENTRPRLSLNGALFVALLAVAGWFAAPAWSQSPPRAVPDADDAPVVADMPEPPDAPPAAPDADDDEDNESALAGLGDMVQEMIALNGNALTVCDDDDDHDADDDDDNDPNVDRRLQRLERQIEELNARLGNLRTPAPPFTWNGSGSSAGSGSSGGFGWSTGSGNSHGGAVASPRSDGNKQVRTYHVSRGKAEALLALMSRQDVPILVSGGGDSITVTATRAEHRTFEAFLRMIDPDGHSTAVTTPGIPVAPRAAVRPALPRMPRAAIVQDTPAPVNGQALEEAVRAKVERAMRDSDKMAQKADKLREKAEKLRAKAESASEDLKGDILKQAEELRREAEVMAREGQAMARSFDKQKIEQLKKETKAVAQMKRRHKDKDGDDDEDNDNDSEGGSAYSRGYELHMKGEYQKAIELFQKSAAANENKGASLYNIACGYARLGQKDKAYDYLKKAWDAGYRDREHMKQDDDLKSLRGDSKFKEFIGGEDD